MFTSQASVSGQFFIVFEIVPLVHLHVKFVIGVKIAVFFLRWGAPVKENKFRMEIDSAETRILFNLDSLKHFVQCSNK